MALIDKASLLMVPSTYEDGTLYNILPSGNKAPDETGNHNAYDQTRADFTFSRGSNLAATRVNASGLIEKGRENIITYSNDFTNASWSKNSIQSVTGGHLGYDGSNDAGLIVPNTTSSAHQISKNTETFTGLQTYSIYAKNGGYDLQLRATGIGSTNIWVSFDLTNGVVGTSGGGQIDSSITSVGNGWYRCSMTFNTASPPYIGLYQVPNGATSGQAQVFEGDGTSGLYVQDAQVEYSLVPTDYIETTTTTATAGVLENTPRIDYSSGAGALLLEPQRTNLYTHSEYYDSYTKVNLSVTTNAITSPEGIQNASKLVSDNSGPNIKRIQPSISTTGTNEYIISAFVKKAEWDYFFIYGAGTLVNGAQAIFNLNTGTIEEGSGHSTMEVFGDDGWYKITWKATSTGTGTGDPRIGITDNASSSNSTGDGVSGAYLYGLQIEQASHASSYVPTYGSAATRGADSCSVTGASDVIGQTEGTLFMDVNLSARDSYTYFALAPNLGSTTAYIGMGITSTAFLFEVVNSGVQVVYNYPNSSTGNFKMAFAYKANDFVAYVNGTQVMTDTSGSVPACSQIGLNVFDKDQPLLYKQAVLFNERLSNTELATLTTL